jgi:Tfp pilus assembly protein PilV
VHGYPPGAVAVLIMAIALLGLAGWLASVAEARSLA